MKSDKINASKILSWLNAGAILWMIIFAVIWLSIGLFTTYMLEKQIVESLGENTGNIISTTMSNHFKENDFNQGFKTELMVKLDSEFSRRELAANNVTMVKILDIKGKVMYCTDTNMIGSTDQADVARIQTRTINSVRENESFSIIVPIRGGEPVKTLGVFEIYTDYATWSNKLYGMRWAIWSFIGVSAFLMLLAFNVLIKRATITIEGKNEVVDNLGRRLEESHAFLSQTNSGTISALLKALDAKDRYTAKHSSNVAKYAQKIGCELGMAPKQLQTLETAAILHDIGKIGIPEHVLNKRGSLTEPEFALVKKHSEIGSQIVHFIYFLEDVAEVILYHHERFDGSGYPHGISGDDIPLTSRILAVADVYDAVTTDRPYRSAIDNERARKILLEGIGTLFDPAVVTEFLRILEQDAAA